MELTTEPHARGLRPENITLTPSGLKTTVTVRIRPSKKKYVRNFRKVRTQKSLIMLVVLSLDKS